MPVSLKSAYLPYEAADGVRCLAETLWPEGVHTHELSPYLWVRELAPSYYMSETALWQHRPPEKFREEYLKELQMPQNSVWFAWIVGTAGDKDVTLLHRSHKKPSQILAIDTSVYYLKEFIEQELNKCSKPPAFKTISTESKTMSPESAPNQAAQTWANEGGR